MTREIRRAQQELSSAINCNIEEINGKPYTLLQFIIEEKDYLKSLDPENKLVKLIEENIEAFKDKYENGKPAIDLMKLSEELTVIKSFLDIPEEYTIINSIGDYIIAENNGELFIFGLQCMRLSCIGKSALTVVGVLEVELKEMIHEKILPKFDLNEYTMYYPLIFADTLFIFNKMRDCFRLQELLMKIQSPTGIHNLSKI